MSQKKNLCFYSNSEKWSKAFIEELSKTPWFNEFEFICVDRDKSGAAPTLPKWLKQVPTLVVNNDPTPIKTDTEVMNWLYEKKMKESPKKVSPANPTQALLDGPQSWLSSEMDGYGNSGYSFLDSDMTTAGNGGSTIPGNFSFLNGASGAGDRESMSSLESSMKSQASRSKKEVMFDSQMEMYKSQRDLGIPQGPGRQ